MTTCKTDVANQDVNDQVQHYIHDLVSQVRQDSTNKEVSIDLNGDIAAFLSGRDDVGHIDYDLIDKKMEAWNRFVNDEPVTWALRDHKRELDVYRLRFLVDEYKTVTEAIQAYNREVGTHHAPNTLSRALQGKVSVNSLAVYLYVFNGLRLESDQGGIHGVE